MPKLKTKITADELRLKLLNPDTPQEELQRYFDVEASEENPFSPELVLNQDSVEIEETEEFGARSAALMNLANSYERAKRRARFDKLVSDPSYAGPVIVSEGDSWFQYPIKLKDTIDWLLDDFAILSVDAAGDKMSDMVAQSEYLPKLKRAKASFLLLSAGGNDLLGGGALGNCLRQYEEGIAPKDYLLPSFDVVLGEVLGGYRKIFSEVHAFDPAVKILVHGYDMPIPRPKGPWLGKPLLGKGVKDASLQVAIAGEVMDRFNEALKRLVDRHANAELIDLRGTATATRWFDEIHPNDAAFGDIASRFREAILSRSIQTTDNSSASKAKGKKSAHLTAVKAKLPVGQPKGLSINIGLNTVDPGHYQGWDGKLNACEYDAQDMHNLAKSLGYDSRLILTKDATRGRIIDHLETARNTLSDGDTLLLTYSGHGGQIADFGGDETDGIDETWCLFDGQLIDDELFELWASFRAGVRIILVSDSCHSGSIYKNTASGLAILTADHAVDLAGNVPRCMPGDAAAKTARANADFYDGIQDRLLKRGWKAAIRQQDLSLGCTVRTLSGCMDNQYSYDGVSNGQFTGRLLKTWNKGKFAGSYAQFHRTILGMMPDNQSTQHTVIGSANEVFDRQTPFAFR